MELNEVLKTVLKESSEYSNESEEELSDYDRIEVALEMLYGVKENHKGLSSAVLKLYELFRNVSEEMGYSLDEDEDDDENEYEDDDDEDEYEEENDEDDEGENTRSVTFTFN